MEVGIWEEVCCNLPAECGAGRKWMAGHGPTRLVIEEDQGRPARHGRGSASAEGRGARGGADLGGSSSESRESREQGSAVLSDSRG